jgi:hypothetical protein
MEMTKEFIKDFAKEITESNEFTPAIYWQGKLEAGCLKRDVLRIFLIKKEEKKIRYKKYLDIYSEFKQVDKYNKPLSNEAIGESEPIWVRIERPGLEEKTWTKKSEQDMFIGSENVRVLPYKILLQAINISNWDDKSLRETLLGILKENGIDRIIDVNLAELEKLRKAERKSVKEASTLKEEEVSVPTI